MQIRVTETDIKVSQKGSLDQNPISRALQRQARASTAVVGSAGILLCRADNSVEVLPIPPEAKGWLRDYERGMNVGPTEFEFLGGA
jgi:hypothetical protein